MLTYKHSTYFRKLKIISDEVKAKAEFTGEVETSWALKLDRAESIP